MRQKQLIAAELPLILIALGALVLGACSSRAADDEIKQTTPLIAKTRAEMLDACVRMHSCGVGRLVRVSECVSRYEKLHRRSGQEKLYQSLHGCVNQAAGDCDKVLACFGSTVEGSACEPQKFASKCDGTTMRYCDSADKRVYAIDCAKGGLACSLDSQGQPFCGAGACTTPGKGQCDGIRLLTCRGSGFEIDQCDTYGLECGINSDGLPECTGTGKECKG
ncbi:MAG: hypothetical protein H6707_01010 [Deltaproteobacteria bacterium]|nr:hypothetical protein [Deltaproteobacteria bacterium]